MSVSPLISVSVLQADFQLAVHGEYTGGFANKRRDNSVLGRGEIGNRWENCSNCCLCFDMTNWDAPKHFLPRRDPSRMCHTFMRCFVRKYKCHTKRSTVTLISSIIYVIIYFGDCKTSIQCFDSILTYKIIYKSFDKFQFPTFVGKIRSLSTKLDTNSLSDTHTHTQNRVTEYL